MRKLRIALSGGKIRSFLYMKKLLFPLCCGVIVEQIKRKDYLDCLKNYTGEVLLVGVNYDKEKRHTCRIERAVI